MPSFEWILIIYLTLGIRVWFAHGLMELERYGRLNFNAKGMVWFLIGVSIWPGFAIGMLEYGIGKGK